MTFRVQLFLVSLLVLVLPWSGCQYVREMETALRRGQEDALLGNARAIASVLQNRLSLFWRTPGILRAAGSDARVIYAHSLTGPVQIDGYVDDWDLAASAFAPLGNEPAHFAAGQNGRYLYFFLAVSDERVTYATGADARAGNSDRLVLSFLTPEGRSRRLLFATAAPGPILARAILPGESGELPREQRALANWQETNAGFNLELRLPLDFVSERIELQLFDVDADSEDAQVGRLTGSLTHELRPLNELLAEFAQPGLALRVTDENGWVLGAADASDRDIAGGTDLRHGTLLNRLYTAILGTRAPVGTTQAELPGRIEGAHVESALAGGRGAAWYRAGSSERAIIAVAEPVLDAERVIGTVVLEQGSERILTLTDEALTRLLNLTLFASFLAAAGLLAYATWLSLRIRRLRDAAESAIAPDGRATSGIPGTRAGDELGDLARSFSDMLGRLDDYTDYLRSLASKLSHELRTPLAVISTSLENLEHKALPDDAKPLAARALDGAQRLSRIITEMSAATHIEQSIETAERECFDLAELVGASGAAYRDVFPERSFAVRVPDRPCPFEGAPDLLSQMLDKLIDNAVDFSNPDSTVQIILRRERDIYRLSVINAGSALPENMRGQLFDSLVSVREHRGETPHLGLGLHIALLIAEFHRGTIVARDTKGGPCDESGVELEVCLPAQRIQGSSE